MLGPIDSLRAVRQFGREQVNEGTAMAARFRGNLFASMFVRSRREQYLAEYVIRECSRGKSLDEVLNDPYIRNRTNAEQRSRLLDRPDVVARVGENALEELRTAVAAMK